MSQKQPNSVNPNHSITDDKPKWARGESNSVSSRCQRDVLPIDYEPLDRYLHAVVGGIAVLEYAPCLLYHLVGLPVPCAHVEYYEPLDLRLFRYGGSLSCG